MHKYKLPRNILNFITQRNLKTTMQPLEQEYMQKIHSVAEEKSVYLAKEYLMANKIISLPTDTVYGLACNANSKEAVEQLYHIKGRDFHKPVAICVKDITAFRKYGQAEHLNDELLQSLLPGPITVVVQRTLSLNNPHLNPSTSKIGIRIPKFSFINQLCDLYDDQPLALTSANRSSAPSSLNIMEFKELWPQLGGIFDAGPIGLLEEQRSASTVVDLAQPGHYKIVREGVALKTTLEILHKHGLKLVEPT